MLTKTTSTKVGSSLGAAFSRDPLREVGKLTGVTECDVDTSAGVQVYANVMESAIVTEGGQTAAIALNLCGHILIYDLRVDL